WRASLAGSDDRPRITDRRKNKERRQHHRRKSDRRSGLDRRDEASWRAVAIEEASTAPLDDYALVAAAVDVRLRAQARFSNFKVGAALETDGGEVITGCNVENATYGLTMCAERVALYKALSEGKDLFTRIAVVADTEDPTPPCGSCRQLLW